MAATYNLEIDQGATFRLPIAWKTKVGLVETPVNLTGIIFTMQIRRRYANQETVGAAIISLSSAAPVANGSITIVNASQGELEVVITDEGTLLLIQKDYFWDIEALHPDGSVTRLLQGKVIVSPEVTRNA